MLRIAVHAQIAIDPALRNTRCSGIQAASSIAGNAHSCSIYQQKYSYSSASILRMEPILQLTTHMAPPCYALSSSSGENACLRLFGHAICTIFSVFLQFINVSHRHRCLGFFRFRAPPPVKASDLCLDINAFEALSLGPRHCMESRTKAARHAHVQLRSVRFRPQERSATAAHAIAILISAQYHRATGLGSTMNACLYIFIPTYISVHRI